MKSKREHVKVWVRTKPTIEYASNLINIPPDNKVLYHIILLINRIITSILIFLYF